MRKKSPAPWIILITITFVSLVAFIFIRILSDSSTPAAGRIQLDTSLYDSSEFSANISAEQLEELIAAEKSFVVYISLPLCTENTAEFRDYVNLYQREHQVKFYAMTSDAVKSTSLHETVKYFPSVVIYDHGKIAKYLDSDSNADLPYYKSKAGFAEWFETYVEAPWTK